MSTAAIQFKIMPESPDVDLEKMKEDLKKATESFESGVFSEAKEEPIAFGLVALIVTIALFWRVRKLAAILLLPYLAWVCFATLLNYEFLQLNPESDGAEPTGAIQRIEI